VNCELINEIELECSVNRNSLSATLKQFASFRLLCVKCVTVLGVHRKLLVLVSRRDVWN